MKDEVKLPTTRNAITTFNLIIDAAMDLFYQKGYHRTTINDITKKAGVAAGTFYLYFPSKYALYKHLLIDFSHEIRTEISAKVRLMDTRIDKEREGIKAFINYAQKHPQIYNIIWESLYIDRELFKDYYNSFAERYTKALDDAVSRGTVQKLDTEIVSFVLIGITTFMGLKTVLKLGKKDIDVEAMVETIMQLLQNGLFA